MSFWGSYLYLLPMDYKVSQAHWRNRERPGVGKGPAGMAQKGGRQKVRRVSLGWGGSQEKAGAAGWT